MDTTNRHSFDVPAEFGFTFAMRLGARSSGGIDTPLGEVELLDDWGIYADVTGHLAGFGYDLIVRGTLAEVKAQVAKWVADPEAYWTFAFHFRNDAIARHERAYQQPWIPPIHPDYAPTSALSAA